LEAIEQQNTIPVLLEKIKKLKVQNEWDISDHGNLEAIDQAFTKTLLTADNSSGFPKKHPWSPQLHIASQVYEYWCIVAKSRTNNISVNKKLQKNIR
jgi:hypothetical protein